MEVISGRVIGYDERTHQLKILAKYENIDRLTLRQYKEVAVGLNDSRTITAEQRRKSHALIAEIAEWCGEAPESMKRLMKLDFITNRLQTLQKQLFSLSDCDVTTAKEFITYLIDFILEHGVSVKVPLITLCDDIGKYIFSCLMHKRCAVCGKKADLHHYDAIGMGNDRKEIFQIGMRVLPLCREHHTIAHTKGKDWIKEQHLEPIKLTKEIGKKYGLNNKNLGG